MPARRRRRAVVLSSPGMGPKPVLTLITGGARSGKSRLAVSLCSTRGRVGFVATASGTDDEMRSRIERHRRQRPGGWLTVEEPRNIGAAALELSGRTEVVLVDCLTLWISRLLVEARPPAAPEALREAASGELDVLRKIAGTRDIVLVTNEVGSGVVPENALARRFRDLQGWVNQRAAAAADRVLLVVAGIPVEIKSPEKGDA